MAVDRKHCHSLEASIIESKNVSLALGTGHDVVHQDVLSYHHDRPETSGTVSQPGCAYAASCVVTSCIVPSLNVDSQTKASMSRLMQ